MAVTTQTKVETKVEPVKKGRAKKGEGPYTISFVDTDNKEVSRIPTNVSSLKIATKDGKSHTFAVSSLSPAVLTQLATDGLRRRLDAFMRNGIGGKETALELAETMFGNIKAGKLYTKAEGKVGAGRGFDFDLWIAAIKRTAEIKNQADAKKHKIASKGQLEALRTKLESATPVDRSTIVGKWKKDPTFVLAKKQVDAERAGAKMKDAGESEFDALADAF